jgi:hypothetical protein
MQFQVRRSPRAAIAMICGCSLVALFLFQRNLWRDCAGQEQSVQEQFVAKYEPLRPLMPTNEAAQFVIDEGHVDLQAMPRDARWFLAQYAVSPRLLGRGIASRWIVVDSDSTDTLPEIASSAHWSLIADLHNGVRLYRNDPGE